jgi:hypothetical protein
MRHVTKAGQPANSNERGAGLVVHAVDSECSVFGLKQPAICGDTPRGRLGWSDWLTLGPPLLCRQSPVPIA